MAANKNVTESFQNARDHFFQPGGAPKYTRRINPDKRMNHGEPFETAPRQSTSRRPAIVSAQVFLH
jgi:hypothetical protein